MCEWWACVIFTIINYFFYFFYFLCVVIIFFFFFNDTATTEIYTLSLHDALPILPVLYAVTLLSMFTGVAFEQIFRTIFLKIPAIIIVLPAFIHLAGDISDVFSARLSTDRKSTRLNSSHTDISRMPSSAWKKKKK